MYFRSCDSNYYHNNRCISFTPTNTICYMNSLKIILKEKAALKIGLSSSNKVEVARAVLYFSLLSLSFSYSFPVYLYHSLSFSFSFIPPFRVFYVLFLSLLLSTYLSPLETRYQIASIYFTSPLRGKRICVCKLLTVNPFGLSTDELN